jgi:hypothetical protein
MSQSDGYPGGDATTLNDARQKPLVSRRRIEHLKQLAYDCNLTNEQARQYGKLSVTATWEKLLSAHGLEFEPKVEVNNSTVATTSQESARQLNLLEWVDFGQLLAVSLTSAGFAVLVLSLWPRINPLNLFPPVRINIQIGATK